MIFKYTLCCKIQGLKVARRHPSLPMKLDVHADYHDYPPKARLWMNHLWNCSPEHLLQKSRLRSPRHWLKVGQWSKGLLATGHRCKTCRNVSFIAFHCDKLLVFTRVRLYVLKLDMAHSMTDLAMPCQSSAADLFATAAAAALVPNKATEALVLKRVSDPCDLDLLLFNGKRECFERELGHATAYELQSDKGKTVQMSKSCLHQKMIRTKNTLPQHKH